MSAPLRVVALADSDSYVKWAASLLARWPGADVSLLVVRTSLVASDAQLYAALAASGLDEARVRRIDFADMADAVAGSDIVVLAARGPVVRLAARRLADLTPAPVLMSGLPGIGIPARAAALRYRRQCDAFIVHSVHERQAFGLVGDRLGLPIPLALSSLPFVSATPASGGGDLVFAAQALVPRSRGDREHLIDLLIAAAHADPDRRVVVKLRAGKEEKETHRERHRMLDLLASREPLPANLVLSFDPMNRALETAEGLVTVSSTAAIEAAGRGVPVIVLDSFGVSAENLNEVFLGSGLLAGETAVLQRLFRTPEPAWLAENYFHPPERNDVSRIAHDLVERRRAGSLPPRPPGAQRGGRMRAAWDRKRVLGDQDRSVSGMVALLVGAPLRLLVLAGFRTRARVQRITEGRLRGPA